MISIAAGDYSSLALKNDGTLAFWGDTGQTNLPAGLTNVVAIAAGYWNSLVLRGDGAMITWGSNFFGQTNIPSGMSSIVAIAAGGTDGMAIRSNGTIVVWGDNGYGQTNVPANATNVVALAGGFLHILALRGDGKVVAWGNDSYGQIDVPPTLSNVVAIAAGRYHSLALQRNGKVVAWGNNGSGQTTVPAGLSNVVAISALEANSLALTNDGSPWFLQQPLSQTVFSGMTARLSVQVIGITNLTYQWYFNGAIVVAATNLSLSLTNVQTTNSGIYTVVASNSIGVTVSSKGVLSVVDSAPFILSQPTAQIVALNSNAVITASVAGSLPISYQWQFYGTNIPKATNALFTLTNAQFTNNGNYFLVMSNAFGSVTGLVSTLTVMDLGMALNATNLTWTTSSSYPWFPEVGTTHDGFAAAQSGSSVSQLSTLQTSVTGPGTLTFWAQNSKLGDYFLFNYGGFISSLSWTQYTVYLGAGPLTLQWQFARYPFGYGLDVAWLDQISFVAGGTAPFITAFSGDQSVPAATNVSLSFSASGTPPMNVQWQFNGTNIASATNSTITLTNVQAINGGNYSFTVTNAYGVASSNLTLTVIPTPPAIIVQPTNQAIWIRSNVTFQVAATGSTPFTYQWQFNGTNIDGATNSTFSLVNLQKTNAGIYQANVFNDYGHAASSNAQLWVVKSAVVAWGGNNSGETNVPFNCIEPQAVTAGGGNAVTALALNGDQTVAGWGSSQYGQLSFPAGLSNVVAVGEENEDSVVLKSDGTVMVWGADEFSQASIPPRLSNIIRIAAGGWHMLALDGDGVVHAYGYDNRGQVDVPAGLHDVVAVAAGMVHSLALTSDGTLVAWGDNSAGETNVPAGLTNILDIAASQYHNLVLKTDGTVFAWGGEATNVPAGLSNVVAIACAQYQCMALRSDGTAVIWGDNTYGQTNIPAGLSNVVGLGGGTDFSLLIVNDGSPWIVRQPRSQMLYDGYGTTLAVTALGVPPLNYQWQLNGTNLDGATNASLALTNLPSGSIGLYGVIVSNSLGVLASAAANVTVVPASPVILSQPASQSLLEGGSTVFNVKIRGVLPLNYQWRFNGTNIDGATSNSFCLTDAQLGNLGNYDVVVGNKYGSVTSSVATLTLAQIVAWGDNSYGQTNVLPGLSNIVAISAGYYHVLALINNGTVTAWGASTNNMNSIVDFGQTTVPVGLSNVVAVASGSLHSLALKSDGSVIAWGFNNDGETNVPPGATNVIAISTGYNHSFALRHDSTIVAWGLNNYGQATVPTGLSNVVATAAGVRHSLALKNDGTVVVWGNQNVAVPFPSGLNNAVAVAAGGYHSIALKSDGTVVCWGRNAEGESTPPAGLSNVVAIAGGYFHSLALKADGTLVGWGYDKSHQIDIPSSATNLAAVTAGYNFSVALLKSGCPFVVNPLKDQIVYTGQTVMFNASAWGTAPLSFQWQRNGIAMYGATNAVLVLTNTQPANSGVYRVMVHNAYGNATSDATLTVIPFQLEAKPGNVWSATNGFAVQVEGVSASNMLIIFASTDLVNWLPIFTNGSATGTVQFMDSAATNLPARFYRAMEQ